MELSIERSFKIISDEDQYVDTLAYNTDGRFYKGVCRFYYTHTVFHS